MSAVDPLALDPETLSVAIELPQSLWLRTGDGMLRLTVHDQLDERFVLQVEGLDGVAKTAPRRHVLAARIAGKDRDRFMRTQAAARAARARPGTGNGSMTVAITGACRTQDLGGGPVQATIYLRTSSRHFRLAQVDLGAAIGAGNLRRVPPCGSTVPLPRASNF
ncbi:hypothetical protein [Mesorhizobium marinum]|uniref:hypothetical protein n=1 Tax=Mesorhizobium marinum TaxID=3228790 RepID=UPI003465A467